jgi:hypothetical protein
VNIFTGAITAIAIDCDLTPDEEKEAERQHWNGDGTIEFYVSQNAPGVFEIEVLDYDGCAGGMQETIGIEYYISEIWNLQDRVREGVTYELQNVTVQWTRGEWGFTDDDVEYDFLDIASKFKLKTYLRQKISNIWWRQVTCRIARWEGS